MLKATPVKIRDWGLLGLHWVIPVALLISTLAAPAAAGGMGPGLITSIGLMVLGGIFGLLVYLDVWNTAVVVLVLLLDTAAALAAVYLVDAQLAWLALIPVTLAGVYFGWITGLLHGVLTALLLLLIHWQIPGVALGPSGLALLAGCLTVGPLMWLLTQERLVDETDLVRQLEECQQQTDAANYQSSEVMAVVCDMAEVLSASQLDPNRVLESAISFGLEGLARVGVEPPLFAAILLFAGEEDGLDTELRMARASSTLAPADREVSTPGKAGAIDRALRLSAPALSHAPDVDPELSRFETFRGCQSVLCLPLNSGVDSYGVMLVGSHELDAFETLHVDLMWAVANQAAASLNNAKLYGSLQRQRDRIVEVEKTARAQLAADLHDGPTQGMSAITMRLNYIRRLLDKKPEGVPDELYKIEDLARRTTKEVRMMLFELRPKSLDHGLSAGLDQLAKKMLETYNQNVEVQVAPGVDDILNDQATMTLFSIVTEALHNARKHAQASLIRVLAGIQGDNVVLVIEDNGRGFNVEEALAASTQREGHLGLNNQFDRAAVLDGELIIDSAPGQGSRLTVTVPLETLRLRRAEETPRQDGGTAA